jgi:hypothetical protein
MKKMLLSILLLAVVLLNNAMSQSVTLPDQYGTAGTQVVIPVMIQDFANISAITLDFSYNPAILQYQSFQNPHLFGGFVVNAQNMGSVNWLSLAWNDLTYNPMGIDIPDGILINIVFNYTGNESELNFIVNNCTALKMPEYNEVQLATTNGSIKEEPEAIVYMLDQYALAGQIKVPLMANFSGVEYGVGSFTFFIIYDNTKLTFSGLDDIALPTGSVFVNTISNPSRLIVDWVNPDPLGGGYTADGLLLNMVFNYTGDSDTELKFQIGNCVVANNQAYEIDVDYEDAWVFTCPQILADVSVVDPTCVGSMDGAITVSNASGATSYEVSIGSGWFTLSGSYSFTDLEPGTYSLSIRNALEPVCTFQLGDFQIIDPDPLDVFFTIDGQALVPFQENEYCFDTQIISLGLVDEQGGQLATGTPPFSVTFTINGGTPVVLNNLQFGANINLVGYLPQGPYPGQVAAGQYLVEVTSLIDANNCSLSEGALAYYKFTLLINPQPDVFFTIDNEPLLPYQIIPYCFDIDQIMLTLVNEQGGQSALGTPPFMIEFTINGGTPLVFEGQNYNDNINLVGFLPVGTYPGQVAAGSYEVQVTGFSDANGCGLVPNAMQYYNFTLVINPQPDVFLTIDDAPLLPFSEHEYCYSTTAIMLSLVDEQGGQSAVGTPPFVIEFTINNGSPIILTDMEYDDDINLVGYLPEGPYAGQVAAGSYEVQVTGFSDANGCVLVPNAMQYYNFTLVINPQPDVFLTIDDAPLLPFSEHEYCYSTTAIMLSLVDEQGGQSAVGTPPFVIEFTINNGSPIILTDMEYDDDINLVGYLPEGPYAGQVAAGSYEVQVTGFSDANGCGLVPNAMQYYNFTLVINAQPLVSAASLQYSSDNELSWDAANGSFESGFEICLDPVTNTNEFYYLDVNTFITSEVLAENFLNPFYLTNASSATFISWWEAKFTQWNDATMQTAMESILNGTNPMFFIKYTGSDYQLIDGFMYLLAGHEQTLRLDSDYPPGIYTFTGSVTDVNTCVSAEFDVVMEFYHTSTYAFDFDVPAYICATTALTVPVTFGTDIEGGCGYDGVRFKIEAIGPGTVTFGATDSNNNYYSFINNGFWGPSAGFNLPPLYTATTDWDLEFSAPGNYAITFSLIYAPENGVVAGITETVNLTVNALPLVSAASLQYSSDNELSWDAANGSFESGFEICLDPVTNTNEFYYLDVNTFITSEVLAENFLNPFYLTNASSATFISWWAAKFTQWNDATMQTAMESILNGTNPMFFIKYTGSDYQLIDGFMYLLAGHEQTLRLDSDYPPGIYTFTGSVTDVNTCVSAEFDVVMEFYHTSTYAFDFDVPAYICATTALTVPVTFGTDIEGGCGYDGVRFKIEAIGPGTVTFGATDSNNNYYSFINNGFWGPSAGFNLPPLYTATTDWDLEFSAPGNYAITFSLIYAPENGVVAGIAETINIEVSVAPAIIACPDNVIIDNNEGECGSIVNFNEAQFSGIPAPVITYSLNSSLIYPGHYFPVGVHMVEVSASNACGTDNCNFTVTVRDVDAPIVTDNTVANIECISGLIDPIPPIASDNCDGFVEAVLLSMVDEPNPITCNGIRIYTYSYTDAAENTSYWTHTYNVQRVAGPNQIGEPVANSKTVACLTDAQPPIELVQPGLETFDNFNYTGSTYINGNFTGEDGIVWNYVHVTGSTAGSGVYEIDGKGMILRRSGEGSKIFSNPIPGGIGNFSVDLRKAWTGGGIRQVELFINGASYGTSIEFGSLTGEDQTVHTFAVNNINISGDVVIEIRHITGGGSNRQLTVDNISWTSYPGHNGPLVLDVCGNLLLPSEPITIDQPENLTCSGTRIYRYIFEDCASLTYQWDYTYTILPPIVEMPENGASEIACPSQAVQPIALVIADNCGRELELVSMVQTSDNTAGCAGEIVWTATFKDCTEATYFWTYTYTVLAPVFEMPVNGSSDISCPSLAVSPTVPVITDNCGRDLELVSILKTVDNTNGCAGQVVWTAAFEDCAGATYFWTYTYTVLAPLVEMPDNSGMEVSCPSQAVQPTAPVVADNCGRDLVLVSLVQTSDNTAGCAGEIVWTATFKDCTEATYFWTYTYIVLAPVFEMPVNGSSDISCPSLAVSPTVPVITDNCGRDLELVSILKTVDNTNGCAGQVVWTATFEDCAGATYLWTYTYTVLAPVVEMPANAGMEVSCPSLAIAPITLVIADNCGRDLELVSLAQTSDNTAGCAGEIVWTATYEDCSGATHFWVYTYTVLAPVVVMPDNAGMEISCSSQAVQPTAPEVADNCGRDLELVSMVQTSDNTAGCAGEIVWTATFKDCTEATYFWTYTYTVLPTTGPMLIDEDVDCSSLDQTGLPYTLSEAENFDPASLIGQIEALYTDDCGGAVTAIVSSVTAGSPTVPNTDQSWFFVYEYTITDVCGNFTVCVVSYSGSSVPATVIIDKGLIRPGEIECHGATQTISISGLSVYGSLTLIAGESIHLLPGFRVFDQGYLHAYIGDTYCVNPVPVVVAKDLEVIPDQLPANGISDESFFKVFPNPTPGSFVLQLADVENGSDVRVEIYNMLGNRIFINELSGYQQYELNVSDLSPGIYIIRCLQGEKSATERLIKK